MTKLSIKTDGGPPRGQPRGDRRHAGLCPGGRRVGRPGQVPGAHREARVDKALNGTDATQDQKKQIVGILQAAFAAT